LLGLAAINLFLMHVFGDTVEFFASCGKSFCVGFVCWALAPFAFFALLLS
jgi:hypothetical protein